MQWLHKPYYVAGPQVFVKSIVKNWPTNVFITTLTVESYLQSLLASTMSNIAGYLNPDYNTFLSARTPEAIIEDYVQTAINRIEWYPSTGADINGTAIDPVALGTQYGQLQVALMQQINASDADGEDGISLWDSWVAMTGPVH